MNFKMDNVSADRPPFASSLVNRSFTALCIDENCLSRDSFDLCVYIFISEKKKRKGKIMEIISNYVHGKIKGIAY